MISYNKTKWTPTTVVTPSALNNIEEGIYTCVQELNKVGNWAKTDKKPEYTALEVGAEQKGSVQAHEISGTAHEYLFSLKQDTVDSSSLITTINELQKQITTMKSQITKLTTRVKELENEK